VVAVGAVLLLSLVGALVVTLTEKLGNDVTRVPDAFKGLDSAARPPAGDGLTFLLVGTDTRSDVPTTGTDANATGAGGRSDVLMVARLTEDGKNAAVVSIPRDSWVDIPGHGMNKINAAYAFGGPSLLIRTVENLTELHIDHFAVVDFAGFRSVVDAVDGIDVGISAATSNGGVDFHQGVNHLDGRGALAYVRQRYGLTDGDLDRAQRQQNALRAVLTKMAATGILDDPVGLYRLLDAATSFVDVDDSLTNEGLRALTQKVRGVPPENVLFLRAPVSGLGHEGAQSVVYLDTLQADQLWDALRQGTMAGYVERHADDTLGPVTR
jgi:LCP family protein required for cell wall assembly